MKLHLLAENLQNKISFVGRAVSQKNFLPILFNFLLEAKKGKLQISGTDLEIGIKIEIPANIDEEGETTIPAKSFLELINSLPAGKIKIETKENSLLVATPTIRSTFQTTPKDEFPKLYEEKGEKLISLPKEILGKEFSKVVFSANIDTTRPALSGILLKKEGNKLLLVATDGYRLSLKKMEDGTGDKNREGIERSILVSARAIRELLLLRGDGEVGVFISKKNNQILFDQNGTILVGRLIDAEFPNYEKIIPSSFETKVIFNKEEMQKAVKICSIFAREVANIVKLSIKDNKIIVSANTPSVGENTVEVEGKLQGEENEIAFNSRYLLDLLGNIEEEEMVFEMSESLNPGVFKIKEDPTFLHLIMPIRIQSTAS